MHNQLHAEPYQRASCNESKTLRIGPHVQLDLSSLKIFKLGRTAHTRSRHAYQVIDAWDVTPLSNCNCFAGQDATPILPLHDCAS